MVCHFRTGYYMELMFLTGLLIYITLCCLRGKCSISDEAAASLAELKK